MKYKIEVSVFETVVINTNNLPDYGKEIKSKEQMEEYYLYHRNDIVKIAEDTSFSRKIEAIEISPS